MTSQTLSTRILIILLLFISGITTVGVTWSATASPAFASPNPDIYASNDDDDQDDDDQNDDDDQDDNDDQDDDNDGD